nr:cation:proton antiporter [Planomonospora venezuelensis]
MGGDGRGTGSQQAASRVLGQWEPATHFLLAVILVVASTHTVGALVGRLGQPPVVGDILAGILLGPTLLGAVSPGAWAWVFPEEILGALDMTAQLGLVAFMFLLGCELRTDRLRGAGPLAAAVGSSNLAVPFLCAIPLAIPLFRDHAGPAASPSTFVLFMGLAISITALPVLARILRDKGLAGTATGTLALTSAVIGDVVAWAVLAFVLASSGAAGGAEAVMTLVLAAGFVLVMALLVRPLLAALVRRCEEDRSGEGTLLPVVLLGSIASAVVTQLIGVHAIFGAFLFGIMMPRRSAVVERLTGRIEGITLTVLLPLFFAHIGIHTSISALGASAAEWLVFAAVLAVAVGSKLLGVTVVGRIAGLPPERALSLGVLMNCRGLTELVIANIGFQLGIIDAYLFTVLVLVALITTALTVPLLNGVSWWARRSGWRSRPAESRSREGAGT